MEIADYYIVIAEDHHSLIAKVVEALAEGWQPFHSPFISSTGTVFLQALVKYAW